MTAWERPGALGARAAENISRPYGVTADSIKWGALVHAAWEAHGRTGAAAQQSAAPGALGRHLELREVVVPRVEGARGMVKLPWPPPKAAGKDKAARPLFNGHSVLGSVRTARAAAEEEQRRLPLQKAGVGTLSLRWATRRLNSKALRRFSAVWRDALQSPEPRSPKRGPELRISAQLLGLCRGPVPLLKRAERCEGFGEPFAVVEEATGLRGASLHGRRAKTTATIAKLRRRYRMCRIVWVLSFGEVAAVFDLKASFFRVGLPKESRASFRCRAEAGGFVELTRPPMGYKCGPEVLHAVARVVGDPPAGSGEVGPYGNPECEAVWRRAG
ncbi:hypothetical protein ERJ75_001338700 [Trypanosoma vivax]|nr:hypothetical protein ERJ75_001338700 [Trypanosoma vivax]